MEEMFDRFASAFTRFFMRLHSGKPPSALPGTQVVPHEEIVFRPLDPVSSANPSPCLCPVTRQTLKQGDRIFQCRVCQMAYSEAGWDFLREVDHGRCCGCSARKSIFPLPAFRPPANGEPG